MIVFCFYLCNRHTQPQPNLDVALKQPNLVCIGAPHAHILLWLVDLTEEIKKEVYINGKKTSVTEYKPAPNFKNCVQGKKGIEREQGIKLLEEFADLLISISIDESEEKIKKYQTHNHTFTCTKNKASGWIVVAEDEGFGKDDGKKTGAKLKTPKCRFKFPRFPMQKTMFLEPLKKKNPDELDEAVLKEFDNTFNPNDTQNVATQSNQVEKQKEINRYFYDEIVIKKAKVNLNRIKKYMLRNLFEEKKGETNPARENFFSLSFDEFLKELDMSEEDYLLALRSGVSGNGYMFMKRSCKEVYTNNFNRNIMETHPANNDFTLCIDENQVAAYIAKYITKNEGGQSKMLKEVDEQCAKEGLTYSEKLKKFANALDQSREVSVQEIIYRLLGYPMAQFSRKIKYLSTTDCQHRDGILKPDLSDLQEGESVFLKSAVDYYEKRPGKTFIPQSF